MENRFFFSGGLRLWIVAVMSVFLAQIARVEAVANPAPGDLVQEKAVTEFDTVTPGQEFLVGVKFTIKKGWHIYWSNPGESGIPTDIQWSGNLPGVTFSPTIYPIPSWFIYGGIVGFGYENETIIMARAKIPDTAKPGEKITFKAKTDWLVCEETCIPGGGEFSVTIQVGKKAIPSKDAALFEKYSAQPAPGAILSKLLRVGPGQFEAVIALPMDVEHQRGTFEKVKFFPVTEKNGPQNATITFREDAQYSPLLVAAIPFTADAGQTSLNFKGILRIDLKEDGKITTHAYGIDFPLTLSKAIAGGSNLPQQDEPAGAAAYVKQIALTFLLAFIGGIILNIMPCVLPVISLKIMGFVQHAHESRMETFKLGLWFGAGILISMWALTAGTLAVQFAGNQIGWGFQFQSPAYVFAMTVLCVLIALSLFGVFEVLFLPGAGTVQLAQKSGPSGAFFNGVLAVVLATPCTAPFMGAALGFAFAQPPWVIALIFTAIGLGLAFPYVLLSAFPHFLKYLPKPGEWMNTAKQLLGFPMLATGVWLLWVFNAQQGRDAATLALFFLLVLAFGFWIYGKFQARARRGGLALALAITLIGFFTLALPALKPAEKSIQPWSPEKVESELKAGRGVFVDFTADWCLSCKVNERLVLKTPEIQNLFREKNIVFLVGDWTNKDGQIARELQRHGRSGVPLYLYYPPGKSDPIILPEVLTKQIVINAVEGRSN